MTNSSIAATRLQTEVQAVLDSKSVYRSTGGIGGGSPHVRNLSATDVALLVAEARGIEMKRPSLYESQASRLAGTGVTVGAVKKALAELVKAGTVRAMTGELLKRNNFGYGASSKGTYYFSVEGAELVEQRWNQRAEAKREADARKRAEGIVLDRYRDEVESLVQTILSGEPL